MIVLQLLSSAISRIPHTAEASAEEHGGLPREMRRNICKQKLFHGVNVPLYYIYYLKTKCQIDYLYIK